MSADLVRKISAAVLPALGHELFFESGEVAVVPARQPVTADDWMHSLSDECSRSGVVVLREQFSVRELVRMLDDAAAPLLLLLPGKENKLQPYLLLPGKKTRTWTENGTEAETAVQAVLPAAGEVEVFSFISLDDFPGDETESQARYPILRRFWKLLAGERKNITAIFLFAVVAGFISLSLPLGIQSLIGFISSGKVMTSAVVLIIFIVTGVLLVGLLQVMQLRVVEQIQQRLFSRTAFRFAWRIPRARLESMLQYYPPELINRFFDVVTLQKGTAVLLTEFSAAALQIVFGLLLLSLYHPLFIFLGIFLLGTLLLLIRFSGPRGLRTSLSESKYKYRVANWLEELGRGMITFRLAGSSGLAVERTDDYVSGYLYYRNQHFKVLHMQYIAFVLFKTLMTALLLGIGCWLVVEQKINIGQFVASEIIIILVMGAVEKIVLKLDTVYDVLTSIDKLSSVTDLRLERQGGIDLPVSKEGMSISIKSLSYRFPDRNTPVLSGLNLDIPSGARLGIAGTNGAGKSTLAHLLLGLIHDYEGVVTCDNISLRHLRLSSLRDQAGNYVSQESLFEGSLLQNIVMGRKMEMEKVMDALACAGLTDYVNSLPDGLNTLLVGGDMRVPGGIARKILLARSFVMQPRIIVIDEFLPGVERNERMRILRHLLDPKHAWTLVIISNDHQVLEQCTETVIMKNGSISARGTFEELKNEIRQIDEQFA